MERRIRVRGPSVDGYTVDYVVRKAGKLHAVGAEARSVIIGCTWHPVDDVAFEETHQFLARAGVRPGSPITLGRYLGLIAEPESARLVIDRTTPEAAWSGGESPPVIQLDGLNAALYPYQQTGAAFLLARARQDVGALLADEMGLGKTLQAIALILAEREKGPSLVVAPASLLPNWRREMKLFAPSLAVQVHAGPNRSGVPGRLTSTDVTIVSYETLVADEYIFRGVVWNVVVADEAQRLRSPSSQRSQAVRSIPSRVRLAVTGTPVENSLTDLWSVSDFILPNVLGDLDSFVEAFPNRSDAASHLGRLVRPLSIRRRVAEVADDLPRIRQIETLVALDSADAAEHERLVASGAPFGAESALSILCAHADEPSQDRAVFGARPKVRETLAILADVFERGEQALVFARFTGSLERLAVLVHREWPNAFVGILDGRLAPDGRQDLIDAFAASGRAGCLLLNPNAGGVGLNITSANHVIHFTPNWNPALTDQATARAYRRGQKRPVMVHHMAYSDSIDQRVLARGDWKRDLADAVDGGLRA